MPTTQATPAAYHFVMHVPELSAAAVASLALLLSAFFLVRSGSALRDESSADPKPFSLSRVLMWWWTLVILLSYVIAYGLKGEFMTLSNTCAILLGVSGATSVGARAMDMRDQRANALERHQNEAAEGFFTDILSDKNGVSVQRFQSLAFHLIYGLSFIVDTFTHLEKTVLPTLEPATLALLGLSSATYLGAKATENATPAASASEVPALGAGASSMMDPRRNDELLDLEPPQADLGPAGVVG